MSPDPKQESAAKEPTLAPELEQQDWEVIESGNTAPVPSWTRRAENLEDMMANVKKGESEEGKALRLAETTDISPKQAKDLMRKHGKDSKKVEEEAENFKAES